MKRTLIYILFITVITGLFLYYDNEIINFYHNTVVLLSKENNTILKNEYYRDIDFKYVQNAKDFNPNNAQDIVNIFYTVINSGDDKFTFFCPIDYKDCLTDVREIASDQIKLSHINNFVHPYNGFSHIEVQYTTSGKVDIIVDRNYNSDEIATINAKVDAIYSQLVKAENSDLENIRIIHDYIINNSRYDSARSDYNILTYKSHIAYGPLIQNYGICGGYSDAMTLFLEKMNIKNFKVSSESHVWNAIYLDGKWYHLDLTWDDPVASDGSDILIDDYFMISTNKLLSLEDKEHKFDYNIYLELKEA